MIRIWIVFLVIMVAVCPAAAQTRVRLEVEAESWLEPTPFDALKEITVKLAETGIEIVDVSDVPVVRLTYEEVPGPGYSPKLVPSTYIAFSISVAGPSGGMFQRTASIRPRLGILKNFPSAAELRVLAIAEFRQNQLFRLLGHVVGAVLGTESSFRPLLAEREPDPFYARILIDKVAWSPSNDDVFVRAFRALPMHSDKIYVAVAEAFLQKNLTAIQTAAADTQVVSPVLAILILEDYGEASATQTLTGLASHPRFGIPAVKALKAIQTR